jgi:uncharacterized caspase-like protein
LLLIGILLIANIHMASARERRVARVVGNSTYGAVPALANPANDATLMARTLGGLGFQLVGGKAQINLDKVGFEAAVRAFGLALPGAEVALFYNAGHGSQVQRANWPVPIGSVPVDMILEIVRRCDTDTFIEIRS